VERHGRPLGKELFDVVVGSVLAALALPVIGVLAVGAAASLRAWPFFVQERVGGRGRRFRILKLRTLPTDAPRDADKYALRSLPLPRFASFLRRHHLDELPQLLLVPFGAMSLVGPRPEMPHLHDAGAPDFADLRTSIRPGCTGLWQVSRDAGRLIWESPEYDRFYLDHAGVRLDLWILWRSALLLAGLAPPVDLDDVPPWTTAGTVRQLPAAARVRAQL